MKRRRENTVTISLRVPWDLLGQFDEMWKERKLSHRTMMIVRCMAEEVERYAEERKATLTRDANPFAERTKPDPEGL
jgi:metal-responsive CopG/Arc/MetJ family transcriptional regulator